MEIKLNNYYKIKTEDELNIILYRKTDKSKAPKRFKQSNLLDDNWKFIGYYISMEHLADDLVEREIKLSDAKSFKDLLSAIKDLKTVLTRQKQ